MIFNLRNPLGKRGGIITEDSFEFTGSYAFARDEESGNWELALWDSGTLTWLADPGMVDLCIVGAGQDGTDGEVVNTTVLSGKGGDGGRIYNNTRGVALDGQVAVVVGESGADSSIGSYTSANGPAPKQGGRGAEMHNQIASAGTVNTGGADGEWPFGEGVDNSMIPELKGKLLAPSGGGGHANNDLEYPGPPAPYHNYVFTDEHGGVNTGGETGAGNGGDRDHKNGYDATGIGAGGGGGYSQGEVWYGYGGGKGSKGAVLLRNHREV